ncbi:MAG TPA: DUF5985 family protein [Steroidobacteraceae bacterium]|nr:DUF5985 family protein [Steroidobacteraceae bacterium]
MALLVNVFCTLIAGLCAGLLLTAYARVRKRLLLWSGLCFAGLTFSNALVVIDLRVLPDEVSLFHWRLAVAAISMLILLYGLVFESET